MVSMAALKEQFEALGFEQVKTYINSGNIIFTTSETDREKLTKHIEAALRTPKLDSKVLLKNLDEIQQLVAAIPGTWTNDGETKCDVLFLWPSIDRPEVISELPPVLEGEVLKYHPGAVIHYVPRSIAAKSRLMRIIGTPLYAQLTMRNINTVRKLLSLMEEQA